MPLGSSKVCRAKARSVLTSKHFIVASLRYVWGISNKYVQHDAIFFPLILSRKRLELAAGETLCEPLLSLLEVDDAPNGIEVL
jgi:hypothetical protein